MSFTPVVPFSGYTGWSFLNRTMPKQTAAFDRTPVMQRDESYFRARIGSIDTAEQLVGDRRLLKVALGAFGLDGDINSKFFIRKVLEGGTLKDGTLANRLSDKNYKAMAAAFGFGDFSVPRTKLSDFPDKILAQYRARQFEIAVGDQSGDLRLALNARRELGELAARTGTSENAKWFTVMGSAPLRQVVEKALGLPSGFGQQDIDTQLITLRARTDTQFGNAGISQFTDPAKVETLIRRFLVRSEAETLSGSVGPGAAALQMLTQTVALARRR